MMRKRSETTIDLDDPRFFLDRDRDIRRLRAREAELTGQRKRNRDTLAELHEQAESESRGGGVSRRRAAAEALANNVAVVERPSTGERIRELEGENLRIEDALGVIAEDLRLNHTNRVSAEVCGELADRYRQLVSRVAAAAVELSAANAACLDVVDTLESRGIEPSALPAYGLRFLAGRVGTLPDENSGVRQFLHECVSAGVLSERESKTAIEGNNR